MKYPPIDYNEYLQVDRLLAAQKLRSVEFGKPAHDELLFIIVHQAYELWFKQMLAEIDSVLGFMSGAAVNEANMGTVVQRLERVYAIQQLINGQVDVLETMTPLDFLEFRDYLYPASGFQSFQWRCIETKLGLLADARLKFNEQPFYKALPEHQQQEILKVIAQPSLFDCVEKWLERTPFVESNTFSFWKEYRKAVLELLSDDKNVVLANPRLTAEGKQRSTAMLDGAIKMAEQFFAAADYEKLRAEGQFRLSYKAVHAALFIQIYRDRPALQLPFRLINTLMDIDEKMTEWRYKHALMVQRMLGRKIGTGGSAGADYLKAATEKHAVFRDFSALASFLIPRSRTPALPKELEAQMDFRFG